MNPDKEPGCPKCGETSGGDWSQCGGDCPMPGSPHNGDRRSAQIRGNEIDQLAKATTRNQGNRAQRRRLQAEFKKHLRSHF